MRNFWIANPEEREKPSKASQNSSAQAVVEAPKTTIDYPQSAKQASNLSKHLSYSEKYGQTGIKKLENGLIRYYGELQPATTVGEMAGRRYVHEFNPITDTSRGWHEILDHMGNIRQVRPELNNGIKSHYRFDVEGNYIGSW